MSRLARADKVAVGEIHVNLLGPSHTMTVKARLVSTKTGGSFATMTVQHWSPATIKKLEELRLCMEEELELLFFDEGGTGTTSSSSREIGGLGEHLDGDDLAPPG